MKLTTHLRVPRSRKCRYIRPLPHTPSWRGAYLVKHGYNFLPIFLLNPFLDISLFKTGRLKRLIHISSLISPDAVIPSLYPYYFTFPLFCPEDGGRKFLWNVGTSPHNYTAPRARKFNLYFKLIQSTGSLYVSVRHVLCYRPNCIYVLRVACSLLDFWLKCHMRFLSPDACYLSPRLH
jgi:hypothetical protein